MNLIHTVLDESEHWGSLKLIIANDENIKTLETISKYLKMEQEHLKLSSPSKLVFVAIGNGPKRNRRYHGKKPKNRLRPPLNFHSKSGISKKQKAKAKIGKNTGHVKCYNYVKKGHFTPDCPKLVNLPFFTKIYECYVCSHAFVTNSLS